MVWIVFFNLLLLSIGMAFIPSQKEISPFIAASCVLTPLLLFGMGIYLSLNRNADYERRIEERYELKIVNRGFGGSTAQFSVRARSGKICNVEPLRDDELLFMSPCEPGDDRVVEGK